FRGGAGSGVRREARPEGGPMADRARDAVGRLLDERSPLDLHAVGGGRERERRDEKTAVVTDARGHAAHAELRFLVVRRPALAPDAVELALEDRQRGERVPGVRRESRAARVLAQPRRALFAEEELPGRRDVQRGARA